MSSPLDDCPVCGHSLAADHDTVDGSCEHWSDATGWCDHS